MTQQPTVGKGQWLISSSPEICVISGLPFLRPLLPNHINTAWGRDKLITCMYKVCSRSLCDKLSNFSKQGSLERETKLSLT